MAIKLTCSKDGEQLGEEEKDIVKRISEDYKIKIERYIDDIISFDVRLKCHSKKGNIKRYVVETRLISPGYRFEASSDEYNLRDAVTKAMDKLLTEIEHKTFASDKHGAGERKKY